jgi:DNA-binding MarR family transcriptional regulator
MKARTKPLPKPLSSKSTSSKPTSPKPTSPRQEQANRGVLDHLLGYQIRRAQTRLFAHFQRRLEQLRITPGQFGLLILIAENPGITQVALARAVGIERATLGEFIDRFEGETLVERRMLLGDRRSYALHLTKKGEAFVDEAVPKVQAHEAEFTDHLTPTERATLLRLLTKLTERPPAED